MQWFKDYISSPTHKWWVDNVWRPSWTKFMTGVYGIPAAIVSLLELGSSFANDSTISTYLSKLDVPNWVPMGLTAIALIHYIGSGRK